MDSVKKEDSKPYTMPKLVISMISYNISSIVYITYCLIVHHRIFKEAKSLTKEHWGSFSETTSVSSSMQEVVVYFSNLDLISGISSSKRSNSMVTEMQNV